MFLAPSIAAGGRAEAPVDSGFNQARQLADGPRERTFGGTTAETYARIRNRLDKIGDPNPEVIPAQAGIFDNTLPKILWMPACVGMTSKRRLE